MHFAFTEDQLAFRDALRDLLEKQCPPSAVRAQWEGGDGYDPALWRQLGEMGVFGVLASEQNGGLGLSELELVLILEEIGRSAMPGPIVEQCAVAIPIMSRATNAGTKWLLRAIAGEVVVTTGASWLPGIPWGNEADLLLIEKEGRVYAVTQEQVSGRKALSSVDHSRRSAKIAWSNGIELDEVDLGKANNRGVLGTAAQLVGLAEHLIAITSQYTKQRKQFGVPIGSYQAIKHQLADAHLAIEYTKPVVYRAAYALTHNEPDASRDTSFAKVYANRAAELAARVALQCHGAIGYSFEYDLHLWMKRVWVLSNSWGDTAWHRSCVSYALLGPDLNAISSGTTAH